jgi:hypothetical protein
MVYTSRPNWDHPDVFRIRVSDGKTERLVDLSQMSKLPGQIDLWFAVTPDDSILLRDDLSGENIFALQYAEK